MADRGSAGVAGDAERAAAVAPVGLPEFFSMRQLQREDRERGFLPLLQQLTMVEPVTDEMWSGAFDKISESSDYHVLVIVDTRIDQLVATGTVFFEHKFIRSCGLVGHIEDVVVHDSCRGMRMGQMLVTALMAESEGRGCYKTILDCSNDNVRFYEKSGMELKGAQMAKYHHLNA